MTAVDVQRPALGLSGYLPGFDGIRAFSVAIVMVSHAGFEEGVPGGLGVTVFFAISGFLITNLLLSELNRTGGIDLKLFYIRRFLRLYPELLALVGLTLLAGLIFGWRASIWEKLAPVLYYFNYYFIFGDKVPASEGYPWRHLWSLAVEEHFYLLYPALILLVARARRALMPAIVALLVLPLAWRTFLWFGTDLPSAYNYVATDARIDSIAWGCLLAVVLRRRAAAGVPMGNGPFMAPVWMAAGVVLLLATLLVRHEDFRWTLRFSLQGIALFLIFANLLFDPRWRRAVAVLEWPVLRYLGRISYGLYLYHMLVFRLLGMVVPIENHLLFVPLGMAATVAMAALSYRLIDDPMKPVRKRFGSHLGHKQPV